MTGKLTPPDWDGQEFNPIDPMLEYLDDLRETAVTNMAGAGPCLQRTFGLDKKVARKVLRYWMETFDVRHPREV